MLIALINILIFLITAGLLVTIIARIPMPLGIVCGAVTGIILALIAAAMFTWVSLFTILYLLWIVGIIGGLIGFRYWARSKRPNSRH